MTIDEAKRKAPWRCICGKPIHLKRGGLPDGWYGKNSKGEWIGPLCRECRNKRSSVLHDWRNVTKGPGDPPEQMKLFPEGERKWDNLIE